VNRSIPCFLFFAVLALMGRGLSDPPDLLVTSGLRGRLEGEGGLPQRAARLRSLRKEGPVMLVEAGQVFYGTGAAPEAPEIIAEIYQQLEVDALHLTPADVSGGLKEIRGLMSRYSLPGISSNLVNAETGEPLFPTGITVSRQGHTYRIIGISAPPHASFPLPPEVRVEDPADALAREMAAAEHPVIVLFSGSPLVAFRSLQPYGDRIAAIAVSGQGRASRIAGIPAVYGGEEGRGIGRLRLSAPEEGAEFIRLERQDSADPAVARRLEQRLEESERDQRSRRAALRPGPPARLPAVGQPVRLLSSTAHQGLGLRVYQWSL
jgi:2',3'-cyclic-nucleotide 2'-phosphodiesterase (5'-nucleotidase family)